MSDFGRSRLGCAFWLSIVAALFSMSCRSTGCAKLFAHSAWDDEKGARAFFDTYKNVLVVRIDTDHWEDRGPQRLSLHHFNATVVKSYKGNWSATERIAFVHGVDAPALTTINRMEGQLMILFTDDYTDAEIGVDTGDFLTYDSDLERILKCVFR